MREPKDNLGSYVEATPFSDGLLNMFTLYKRFDMLSLKLIRIFGANCEFNFKRKKHSIIVNQFLPNLSPFLRLTFRQIFIFSSFVHIVVC